MKLSTIKAAATLYGIGYSELKVLVQQQKLRVVLLPGAKRPKVDLADLEALIEASKSGSKPGTSGENAVNSNPTNTALLDQSQAEQKPRKNGKQVPYYERNWKRVSA